MMKRQVRAVALAGVATIIVIAMTISWALFDYVALKDESILAKELNSGLNDLQYLTTDYLATRTPRALKQWQARHQRLSDFIKSARIRDKDVILLMPEIATRHKNLGSLLRRLIRIESSALAPDRATAAQRAAISRLLNQVLALSTLQARVSEIYEARESEFLTRAPIIIAAILLFGVSIMVFLYARVLRRISQGVELLSDAVVRLGTGEFETPIESPGDEDIGIVFSALEQARLRLADTTLQMEQERADLDHFVYVASHDFKAPLRGIDNLAVWVEEDAGDVLNDEAKGHLQMLRKRVKRLETLLEDLLAYSRAGRQNVAIETVDVSEMIQTVVDDLNLGASITVNFVGDSPIIPSPKVPLEHVFTNLIANAAKHHDRDQGRIEVSGEINGSGYRFRVCDDGPGIPERFREKIFEMFQTLKPRDVVEGSGMGLAIAKRLVQSYNGAITVVRNEGRGTCFEFTWYPNGEQNVELAGS